MPAKKKPNIEEEIVKALAQEPEGLSFTELYSRLRELKKDYYRQVRSYSTLSNGLKSLIRKGLVQRDMDSRKYLLTKEGQTRVIGLGLVDQILSCGFIDMYSDWASTSTYILIDAEKGCSDRAIMVPYKRLQTHGLDWTPEIKEIAEMEGLDYEKDKEKVWEALFKGVNRVILVEMFEPALLLEKLKLQGKVRKNA
jgi:predicted transcriptional regulator